MNICFPESYLGFILWLERNVVGLVVTIVAAERPKVSLLMD